MGNASDDLQGTKRLMGALVRMPPKPHEKMKLGNAKAKRAKKRSGYKTASEQIAASKRAPVKRENS